MDFLEKEIEDVLFNTPNDKLIENGLWSICGHKRRQVNIGNYGIADLVTLERIYTEEHEPVVRITVYELKKKKINHDSFLQAVRYAKGIDSYLSKYGKFRDIRIFFKIVLIGHYVDMNDDIGLLASIGPFPKYFYHDFISIYTYSLDIDGLHFTKRDNTSLAEEGF